jgi:hypothetical protein
MKNALRGVFLFQWSLFGFQASELMCFRKQCAQPPENTVS